MRRTAVPLLLALVLGLVQLLGLHQLAVSATPPPPRASAAGDYRMGEGDLLKISVFNNPEIGTEARISQSGNITFPLIGQVAVAALTTREAETLISQRLDSGGFLHQAQVSVLVVDYQSQKIAVLGQVAKPGQYALTASNKALDVLAEAGGVVNGVAGDQATLVRRGGDKIQLDLTALFEGDPAQNPNVQGGDTIYVPRAPQFYVYGEVQRPGVYRLERKMTVSQAISAGGGLTARGSERRAVVKRRDAAGKELRTSVRGSDLLQPDDVLYVKESLF